VVLLLAALALPAPAGAAASPGWARPVPGPVLRPFHLAADRFARGQHRGVDLGAPPGTAVRAACTGDVRFAGTVPAGGRTVSVRCGPWVATYQHLAAIAVGRGRHVPRGARLGASGLSGLSAGERAHLHLGARVAATGRYVDPLGLLGGAPRPVTPLLRPARRPRAPAPLGPAPRAVPVRAGLRVPVPGRVAAPWGGPVRAPPGRPPWPVWVGLACLAPAIGVGGLARRRARRAARVTAGAAHAHR
jgi:hypothetical protein